MKKCIIPVMSSHVFIHQALMSEIMITNGTLQMLSAVREHVAFHEIRAHSHAADAARLQDSPAENARNAHRTYVAV